MKKITIKPEAEHLFLVLALLFGGILVFLTPPFQAPDEINHFLRTYQILQGRLLSEKTPQGLGGMIPVNYVVIIAAFEDQPFRPEPRSSASKTLANLRKEVSEYPKQFIGFANTAVYSPVNYLPQALGMGIAKLFSKNPLVLMFAGRITNLLIWAALVFVSIKVTPIFKWLLLSLALLPTSIFLASTCSGDPLTSALCFLSIAIILRLAKTGLQSGRTMLNGLMLVSTALALAKPFYLLLLLLFFIIPREKSGSFPQLIKSFIKIFLPGLALQTAWILLAKSSFTPHRTDIVVSPDDQIQYLLHHPLSTLWTIIYSLYEHGSFLINSFIGILGWLDTHLPLTLLGIAGGNLLIITLLDINPNFTFSMRQKTITASVFTILTLAICLSQYLNWNSVGSAIIEGMQGRYFLPFSPLIFLCLYRSRAKPILNNVKIFNAFETILISAILIWTLIEIGNRYYG